MIDEGSTLAGYLSTTGRITGRSHTVRLRLVYYQGRIYASRSDARSDWCRNALKNPDVSVELGGCHFDGTAALVTDGNLRQIISQLKYGDKRSLEPRVVIEITPSSDSSNGR